MQFQIGSIEGKTGKETPDESSRLEFLEKF